MRCAVDLLLLNPASHHMLLHSCCWACKQTGIQPALQLHLLHKLLVNDRCSAICCSSYQWACPESGSVAALGLPECCCFKPPRCSRQLPLSRRCKAATYVPFMMGCVRCKFDAAAYCSRR
jgi:hypothetical protein